MLLGPTLMGMGCLSDEHTAMHGLIPGPCPAGTSGSVCGLSLDTAEEPMRPWVDSPLKPYSSTRLFLCQMIYTVSSFSAIPQLRVTLLAPLFSA